MKDLWLRCRDRLVVLLTLCGLLAAGVFAVCRGGILSSGREYLSKVPDPPSLTDWQFDKQTETYLADRIPFRTDMIALDAGMNVLTGRRTQLNNWYESGAILEKPVTNATEAQMRAVLSKLESVAGKKAPAWYVLTPPTHGWLLRGGMTPLMAKQYDAETSAMETLYENEHAVRMPEAFCENPQTMYYRTDHHWTLVGAYQAYLALGERLGFEPLPLEDFRLSSYGGFHGTTLSGSGLPALWADTLDCAEPAGPVRLTVLCTDNVTLETYDHLIFPEMAETVDGYGVYLQTNYALLMIENEAAPDRTLFIFKDSFANCLMPLLSAHYRRVVAADPRLMNGGYSRMLREAKRLFGDEAGSPDAILFLYSLDHLVAEFGTAVTQ